MKLILYLSVLAVGAAGQSLIIYTPVRGAVLPQPNVNLCWLPGPVERPPTSLVHTYPLSETPVVNFGTQLTNYVTWMVKVPLGTSLIYMIKDSTGLIATSARFKVTTGSGNSCIKTGSTPGGSAGSDPTIGASTAVHQSTLPASKFVSPASSASSVSSASATNTMSRQSLTINTPVSEQPNANPIGYLVRWNTYVSPRARDKPLTPHSAPYFVTYVHSLSNSPAKVFSFRVQTYPLSETPVVNFGQQATNQITWMVKVPLGTSLIYMIKDSTGLIASSAPFKVTSGSGNSCIKTGITTSNSHFYF
ncbi:hypothetical protein B0H13DRAFT_2526991 [Mycena leptocephala]|nr:hypothetical protein B0H13DRAFT_2526991 [Mycena leptocephala]